MFGMSTRWAWLTGIATAFWCNCALAQITPDATLPNNSIININGNTFNITGGTQAGGNLFHSFQQFSVPTGGGAIFNNTVDIQNIISRVTGGSISNIDGLIRTLGTANLFLINPNGIVFGPNARLEIGGSFFASTANSINFADGTKFSATPSPDKPLLTITAPLGLNMGNNSGEIKVNGLGHDIVYNDIKGQPRPRVTSSVPGLEVQEGKTLALVGGKVSLQGGILKSPEGRIEIGSVASNGTVSLVPVQEAWKLAYEGIPSFGDIQFSGKTFVDTTGVGGGAIAIAGRNISLTGQSILLADTLGERNGQEISIVGDSISLIESEISSSTFSSGNAGQVKLVANKSILLESQGKLRVSSRGDGNAGTLEIVADAIKLDNQSLIDATTTSGNGGDLKLDIANLLLVRRGSKISAIATNTNKGGNSGGNISINTNALVFTDESSQITANAFSGTGGIIRINAQIILSPNTKTSVLNFPSLSNLIVDTSAVADTSCGAIASTDSDTDKSKFTITGRGGLPPSPYEPLTTDVLWSDNRIPNIASQQRTEKPSTKPPTAYDAVKIVPATGWVFDGKGHVTLISHTSNANNLGSTSACQKK